MEIKRPPSPAQPTSSWAAAGLYGVKKLPNSSISPAQEFQVESQLGDMPSSPEPLSEDEVSYYARAAWRHQGAMAFCDEPRSKHPRHPDHCLILSSTWGIIWFSFRLCST